MNILCARTHSNDIWIENELLSMSIFFCMFVGTYIVTVSTQQRYPFGCKMHDFVWRSSYKFESEISFAVQYYTRTLIMCQMECWKLSEYSKKKNYYLLVISVRSAIQHEWSFHQSYPAPESIRSCKLKVASEVLRKGNNFLLTSWMYCSVQLHMWLWTVNSYICILTVNLIV